MRQDSLGAGAPGVERQGAFAGAFAKAVAQLSSALKRLMAAVQAARSPGGGSRAVCSCATTSDQAGRSDATMARPAAIYSNSFRGEV